MTYMIRWHKVGVAYRLQEEHKTLWAKRYDSRWHLIEQHTGGWSTLGKFATLTKAKEAGVELMGLKEVTA